MLLAPIVIRLQPLTEFKRVSCAAHFSAAQDDNKFNPAAYVVPQRDMAQPNDLYGGAVIQQVKEQFGVVLAISNLRDVTGLAAQQDLETLRHLTIQRLLGFQPSSDYDPIEYVSGQLLMLTPSVMWWQLVFSTGYTEQNY